ncbi:hypothetical protein FRC12_020996 [Ceratobasidium sp. 428]|nr:hypothetical protein FRC12_020996 [Ceratobasidium sp. 428]
MSARRYRLLNSGETYDDPNILWLERLSTWSQRVGATLNWLPESQHAGGWRVTLTSSAVNGHVVPNHFGQGANAGNARVDLVRKLEVATPAIFVSAAYIRQC